MHNWWHLQSIHIDIEDIGLRISVTKFGEISPLWQNDMNLRQVGEGLFSVWQNFGHTLANMVLFLDNVSML